MQLFNILLAASVAIAVATTTYGGDNNGDSKTSPSTPSHGGYGNEVKHCNRYDPHCKPSSCQRLPDGTKQYRCGKHHCYNKKTHKCKYGRVIPRKPTGKNCGIYYRDCNGKCYNPGIFKCVDGHVVCKQFGYIKCGKQCINTRYFICGYDNKPYCKKGSKSCGKVCYKFRTEICKNGYPFPKHSHGGYAKGGKKGSDDNGGYTKVGEEDTQDNGGYTKGGEEDTEDNGGY